MLSGKAPGWLAGKGWSSPQCSGITIPSCLTAERQARIPLGRQPLLLMEPSSLAETAGTSSTRERSILLASGQLLQQSVLGLNPWPDTTLSSRFFGFLYLSCFRACMPENTSESHSCFNSNCYFQHTQLTLSDHDLYKTSF